MENNFYNLKIYVDGEFTQRIDHVKQDSVKEVVSGLYPETVYKLTAIKNQERDECMVILSNAQNTTSTYQHFF